MKEFLKKRPVLKLSLLEMLISLLPILLYYHISRELGENIPTHFGLDGKPDDYSPKWSATVWMILVMGCYGIVMGKMMYVMMLAFYKHKESFPIVRKILLGTEFCLVVFFTFSGCIAVKSFVTHELDSFLLMRLLMAVMGIIFIITGNYAAKLKRNYLLGIRTSFSLSSDEAWKKVHVFGGKVMVAGGVLMTMVSLLLFIPHREAGIICGIIFVGMVVLCVAWRPALDKKTD